MEGPSRSAGMRKSRRSRSQRDRELRRRRRVNLAEERATSLSSGSDREGRGTNNVLAPGGRERRPVFGRHRPPRRRKRESVSCEEDIIDGFAIASFISLEALEMDCSLKPNQRTDMLGRQNKRKRGPEENGGGPLSEPEEGAPHSYSSSYLKRRSKRRKIEGSHLETGYICDTESDTGDKASDNEMDPVFTVSTRKAVDPSPSNLATAGKSCPPLSARCGGISRLMVTPRVSGLERSQETSLEPHFPEPFSSSTSPGLICMSSPVTASVAVPRPSPVNGNGTRHNGSPPLSKPKPYGLPPRSQSIYNSSAPVKTPSSASSVATSSASMRPPTPSTSVSLPYSRGSGSSGPLRPPSRASSGALFTSSPGLPPPPPLLPPAHSAASAAFLQQSDATLPCSSPSAPNGACSSSSLLALPPPRGKRQMQISNHEREGRRSVPGAENNSTAAAGRSTPGGPSAPNSSSSSSGRTSQNQTSVPPLAFQFHQHNHQHQHTHTHQHFTPFLHPSATAPPLFEKFPSKMDGLYRHPFFPQYPPPSVSSIPPVIPPAGPFGSLQGAFQPKGTAPDLTARLGVVSHHLQTKDHRLTDPFGTSLKISNKPGKWCAMHVHVAWMILSHQRKVKLMQADPHKLDFRSDLLSRFSGAVGLGGALPPTHDLTRPPSLFPAAGTVNPSSAPFISPSAPPSSFLPPAAHLDPYGRTPPFAPLGALGSGAFGGLGSPALAGSVFSPKEPPPGAVGGLPTSNHHIETWNRLHGGPSVFSGGPWIKEMDKRDERDRGKDMERRDIPHIKDEKDRDSLLYCRQPVRMSPVGPPFKPRSSTPVNHINGHSSALGGGGGPIEDLTRSLNRDRDRERDRDGDKRPLPMMSSRAPPLGSSTLVADRDRPRSSSSSVLNTPPPSLRSIPSPLDLYPRSQAQAAHNLHNDHSQRDGSLPASSAASSSISSLSHVKKSDRTTTPVSKPSLSLPTVKVKEERKEEPEHIPITHPPPAPSHTFDRPNSHPHHHSSGTPSSCSLSLTPTPGVPLPPPTPNPPPHQPVMDRSRQFEAILGSTAGLLVGSAGERFPHGPPPGQPQGPHSFTWDPWREIMAHQPHPHRREALALRSDPHLALRHDPHLVRLLQHQRHMVEAERAAVAAAAAAAAPPHPPTSTSGIRPEFGLIPFDRPPQLGPPGGGLLDEEQRAQILREDFERARYFAMHPHLPHGSHLSSPSHAAAAAAAAHLEQLHPGLLPHSLPSGASAASQHHPSLYSRLGPINPHHMSNGILAKDLVGALSVGAPPPLIPSIASRSATPPRTSRLRGPSELALYSTHKDGESR